MRIFAMGRKGHEDIGEWNETTSQEDLLRIDRAFDEFIKKGYAAFLIESGIRIKKFRPGSKEDIFLVAPIAGG